MFENNYRKLLSTVLLIAILSGILLRYFSSGIQAEATDTPAETIRATEPESTADVLLPELPSAQETVLTALTAPLLSAPEETVPEETEPEPEPEPVHEHSYEKSIIKPTPAYRGYTKYTCGCGESYRTDYVTPTLSTVTNIEYDISDVPAEMLNSDVLQALAYLGVDVKTLKDMGVLYRLGYIASKTPDYARSPIPYSGSGNGSGQQTVPDSSTPTGLAPDLSAFKKSGLDCVDFAAYYLANYLPNIKGADISILESMNEKYQDTFKRCYDNMDFWPTACADLANQGLIEAYTYDFGEDYTDVFSNIEPGTLIQMGTKKDSTKHYAIYAGSFNGNHYIIHSGNSDRGPEISLITYMWGNEPDEQHAWPLAFYEFHFPTSG